MARLPAREGWLFGHRVGLRTWREKAVRGRLVYWSPCRVRVLQNVEKLGFFVCGSRRGECVVKPLFFGIVVRRQDYRARVRACLALALRYREPFKLYYVGFWGEFGVVVVG